MEEIVIHHISEDELDAIEDGGADSLLLVFGVSLLSIGLGYLSNLLLLDKPQSTTRFTIYLIIMVITLILGPILLLIWWKLPDRRQKMIAKIRRRHTPPPDGTQVVQEGQTTRNEEKAQ